MEKGYKKLFEDFPDITTTAWEEKIKTDLKGADYHKRLVWKTDEGIEVKPFYRQEDLSALDYTEKTGSLKATGSVPNEWTICQDIFVGSDLAESNSRMMVALKGGAQALCIHLRDTHPLTEDSIGKLLEGIPLDETEILYKGSLSADSTYTHLCKLASSKGVACTHLRGSLGADPLGKMVATGIPVASLENLGKLILSANEESPGLRVIDINGGIIHNAGSTLVEELAFALAMASEYLAKLADQGIDPQVAFNSMQLSLATGPNYFLEIAKLRAARILFAMLAEAYGINPDQSLIKIHSTSSEWNLTLYDPYVNMLRGTTEAMSSILGGADIVSVLPYDYPYGKSTLFSERIARSVQIILREEAYFDRVSDPASGSFYIESLTDSIGEKSWDLFQEVESLGGFRKAFEQEWIQEKVTASRQKKAERAASGRGRILGTNAFPNFLEKILESQDLPATKDPTSSTHAPLVPFRVSAMFEEVRLETERSGKRPRVVLCKYGNPAWMTARATFSGNFFACAGYEILDLPPSDSLEEGINATYEESPDVVVLCSSDETYLDMVPQVIQANKGGAILVIAGYPSDTLEALKAAGIEHFIHMKSNLLESLQHFNSILL